MSKTNKICVICGEPFTTRVQRKTMCSPPCRRTAQSQHINKVRALYVKFREEVRQEFLKSLDGKTKVYFETWERTRAILNGENGIRPSLRELNKMMEMIK